MADWQILSITAAVIVGIVLMIIKLRINPVVSLVTGALVLGLATGLSPAETTTTAMQGFGDIMFEVGLLIAWGVLMGSILNETGAIRRLVNALLRIFGPRGVPYALGLTIGTALQSIFLDVLLVMSAPLARRMAPHLGKFGIAKMATALAISLECGIVLMVPGVATMALAGLLGVPLGKMMIFGFIVVVPTIVISIAIMNFFIHRGLWNVDLDQQPIDEEPSDVSQPTDADNDPAGFAPVDHEDGLIDGHGTRVGLLPQRVHESEETKEKQPSLFLLFGPMLLALVLIATGAILEMAGVMNPVIEFFSTPVVALLIGLLGTSFVARYTIGGERVEKAVVDGFRESGQILILTGAGGSLAAVIAASGMGDVLGQYFTAGSFAPLLTVWAIAAVLHIAVGSVTISAITAAGLLAPVVGQIGMDPVLLALAAGAGSLFMVHVTSNTFWLLQSMLGQTTRGTLKSCSLGVSVASVVALLCTMILGIFL
ncbi:GntP family permease [Corynebacterium alimapuense]|uniref:Gluconate permease n=1 Tax=Corynebacterium alimapuense TaxID=1576874 RepID=A0A3M8K7E1_9CORY|nr:SLC13 family permease [Corynebacterium alimapuense]RNE49133.1 gluconate permease [Corynebacterium alimapuense]